MTWPGVSTNGSEGRHERELCPMSWEELSKLADAGWEIGSHTSSHARLTDLTDRGALTELRRSREECEARMGRPCLSLAYPYGAYDRGVMLLAAEAGYATAAALPPPFSAESVLAWPRVGVYRVDGGWRFRLKVSRTMRRLRRSPARPADRLSRSPDDRRNRGAQLSADRPAPDPEQPEAEIVSDDLTGTVLRGAGMSGARPRARPGPDPRLLPRARPARDAGGLRRVRRRGDRDQRRPAVHRGRHARGADPPPRPDRGGRQHRRRLHRARRRPVRADRARHCRR